MIDAPAMPATVVPAFEAVPAEPRAVLLHVRALIFEIAAGLPDAARMSETLKWGQPSYAVPTGTPLRLGLTRDGQPALFAHCQTRVVADARAVLDTALEFEGNRAILVPMDRPFPDAALRQVIHAALTYRLRGASGRSA